MKKLIIPSLLVLIILFTVSCASTMCVQTLRPAEVNLSIYDKVAVLQTEPYDGFRWSGLFEKTAAYATEIVSDSVSKGTKNLINPGDSEVIIATGKSLGLSADKVLLKEGIEAAVTSSVAVQEFSQNLKEKPVAFKDVNGNETSVTRVYLAVEARIRLSYAVTDLKSNKIIYTGHQEEKFNKEFYLGEKQEGKTFVSEQVYYSQTKCFWLFTDLLDEIGTKLDSVFSQTVRRSSFSLLKSDDPSVTKGLDYAKSDLYEEALDCFLDAWNKKKSFEAGYDASIMYLTVGKEEEALDLAYLVWKTTLDRKARNLYRNMSEILNENSLAAKQLEEN